MERKYYAVKVGKLPGIYNTWDECRENVNGYKGAIYKSFKTLQEAEAFAGVKAFINAEPECEKVKSTGAYAFVDGSFNAATNTYGYGGFVVYNGEKYIVSGADDDAEMACMRNVAGEVLGAVAAIKKAIALGIKSLDIYYDYMGIEMWANGDWKRNKKGTIAYYDFIQEARKSITLNFIKVKGHSGIEGNEEADMLAKKAVNIL